MAKTKTKPDDVAALEPPAEPTPPDRKTLVARYVELKQLDDRNAVELLERRAAAERAVAEHPYALLLRAASRARIDLDHYTPGHISRRAGMALTSALTPVEREAIDQLRYDLNQEFYGLTARNYSDRPRVAKEACRRLTALRAGLSELGTGDLEIDPVKFCDGLRRSLDVKLQPRPLVHYQPFQWTPEPLEDE